MKNKTFVYIITIILILALTFFFFLRAYQNYSVWKDQRNFFNQPGQKIESWMSTKMISERFRLTPEEIYGVLGNKIRINPRQSLELFCKQYKQNCTDLTNKLNVLAGR